MARQSDRDDEQRGEGISEKGAGNGERRKADAIQMLKDDHRRVEQLFDRYEQARRRAEKSKIAQEICLELTIHAELEEEIFYPACREHVDDPLLDEAQIEHDTAKILVAEIAMGTPQTDPFFDAKVTVLAEYVRHHIQEEEKNVDSIFAKALEGGVDTAKLGERMMKRREQLMDEFSEELLLPQPKALHVQLAQEEEVWAEPPGRAAGRGRRAEPRSVWSEEPGGWEEEEEGQERGYYDERRAARGARGEEGRGWRERQGETRGARPREAGRGMGRGETGRGEEARSATGRGGGQEHRGWRGDPERHSEAARRGWEHRR
ncbi:hemerythrin domain-containing protein [Methylocystis sp. JAN1]|uniref:hemerythrin domain-containing protein n=1 Tax=Methylocystis sp. JAN1 TaxID=3397211 RepID=UPI003FA2F8D7